MPEHIDAKKLKDLAKHIASNHIHLAVPNDYRAQVLHKYGLPIKPLGPVVLFFGAGASKAAADLPLGKDTKDILRKELDVPSDLFDGEIARLTTQYRLAEDVLETQLLALSRFSEERLIAKLKALFGLRHYPSLIYELAAHLLKHRWVDAIVNFNFDELLDQAIEDEVGAGQYRRVVTDADVSDDLSGLTDENGRFSFPLYVKPHGTASHGSSLRFTREAYFRIPRSVLSLLEHLLTASRCTILSIGFGLESVEINQLLRRRNPKTSVYIVDKNKDVAQRVPSEKDKRDGIHLGSEPKVVLKSVWEEVKKTCKSHVRDIERHQLIATLFQRKHQGPLDAPHVYLRDRMLVELALAIAKATGFVNMAQLVRGRAGTYYDLYRRGYRGEGRVAPLHVYCERIGLTPIGFSRDAMRLEHPSRPFDVKTDDWIIDEERWDSSARKRLLDKTIALLSPTAMKYANKSRTLFNDALNSMYKGREVEVVVSDGAPYSTLFQSPFVLSSFTAMRTYTRWLLEENDWDAIWVVAESGEWMLNGEVWDEIFSSKESEQFRLVVADRVHKGTFKKRLGDRVVIRWLPWWLHNQHMTIIRKDGRSTAALYFSRRNRSQFIKPVRLEDLGDIAVVEEMFCAYWAKAEKVTDSVITPDDIRAARVDLR